MIKKKLNIGQVIQLTSVKKIDKLLKKMKKINLKLLSKVNL